MKNKKILMMLVITTLIIGIIVTAYLLSKRNKDENRKNVNSGEFSELKINGDFIYYEYKGSSNVERKSMIYKDKNDNWTITTRYFNCGKSEVKNNKLNDDQKKELLDKIKINMEKKDKSQYSNSNLDGGYSNYAIEYISSKEGKGITPLDLEEIGYVQNIYDVL